MIQFVIKGELTDLNTYIKAERTNKFVAAKIKRQETERVATEARIARLEAIEEYPVMITYIWYTPDHRKDVDNIAFAKKFINDGLVHAGVIENDSRKFIAGLEDQFEIDKDNPRIEVVIHRFNTCT